MRSRLTIAALVATLLAALAVAPAHAARGRTQTIGSFLRGAPNVNISCAQAIVRDPLVIGRPTIAPSGQRTCTYRHQGYVNVPFRLGSTPGARGRITRFRVRAGANPAPVRLTVMQGTGSCCTATQFSRVFRLAPNRVNSFPVNMRVLREGDGRPYADYDTVGLSFVGPGTLPLRLQGTFGTFSTGSAIATFWYPMVRLGEPRTEHFTVDGLDLLFNYDFVQDARR